MKYLIALSRLLVGILFIISGLIKLNDPVGFSYKLDEYFGAQVFNLPFLLPYTLTLSLLVVILEVVLGVLLLLGYKPKFTTWSLLGLILFFTFLTFYSAYFEVVKDCGCFGDALKLTPWQSFGKDVILLALIIILFTNHKYIKPLFGAKTNQLLAITSIIASGYLGYYVLQHLPIIDFRPFAVGKNITKGMEIPENAPKSEYQMVFIYDINGQKKEFTDKELSNLPSNAKFIDRIDKVIKQGYVPPIHDFSLEKEGENETEIILNQEKVALFVVYDLEKANPEGLKKIAAIATIAKNKNYKVIAATGSDITIVEKYKKEYQLPLDFYFCDPTTLKTIERSNPSLVLLNKGTVTQKSHYNDWNNIIY